MEKARPYTAVASAQCDGSRWEPDELRGSSPVLREPRGEIPRGHSPGERRHGPERRDVGWKASLPGCACLKKATRKSWSG